MTASTSTAIAVTRCEQIIAKLVIPQPFDVDTFLSELSAQRGRPIKRMSAALPTTKHLCGMLVSTDEADYLCSAVGLPPLLEQHTMMHEVGHLLLDHGALRTGQADDAETNLGVSDVEALRILMPNLAPTLIRRILGRTTYADEHEREAELFASLLLARVTGHRDQPPAAAAGYGPLDVLSAAFGAHRS